MIKVPTVRAASVLLALFFAQAAPAQDHLLLHGADILEGQSHFAVEAERGPASQDFRRRTPILEKAYRRNLRTNSSERYRHHVALFRAGKKLGYFPASEEHRAPLRTVEPALTTSNSSFNWPFTIFFLGLAFVLWRSGGAYPSPEPKAAAERSRTRAHSRRTRTRRISGLHAVVSSTASGTHPSQPR